MSDFEMHQQRVLEQLDKEGMAVLLKRVGLGNLSADRAAQNLLEHDLTLDNIGNASQEKLETSGLSTEDARRLLEVLAADSTGEKAGAVEAVEAVEAEAVETAAPSVKPAFRKKGTSKLDAPWQLPSRAKRSVEYTSRGVPYWRTGDGTITFIKPLELQVEQLARDKSDLMKFLAGNPGYEGLKGVDYSDLKLLEKLIRSRGGAWKKFHMWRDLDPSGGGGWRNMLTGETTGDDAAQEPEWTMEGVWSAYETEKSGRGGRGGGRSRRNKKQRRYRKSHKRKSHRTRRASRRASRRTPRRVSHKSKSKKRKSRRR